MPGPPRVPTEILAARGSTLAQSRATSEPADAVAAPQRPAGLPKKAGEHWDYIVPLLLARRTLTEADLGKLEGMCRWWGEFKTAAGRVEKLKPGKTPKGHMIDHPRVVMRSAWEQYSKAAAEFGLSPAAKSRVVAGEKPKEQKKPEPGEPTMRIAQ